MRKLHLGLQIFMAGVIIGTWTPASGDPQDDEAFHLMSVAEVFPGTTAQPLAQYVMLKSYAAGQNLVAGHKVYFFNASGVKVDSANMPSNVSNAPNQMTILLATTQAATLFACSRDFAMPAAINPAGGKICFDGSNIDCVSWGNYTGSSVGTGTPFRKNLSLLLGKAVKRRMDISGSPVLLESTDDTQNSANDFLSGVPAATNNAGGMVVIPPAVCGNGVTEGLEECDDGNNVSGDGCNSVCDAEYCGDGVVQPGEGCDDGNGISGDGCSLCVSDPVCGNGIIEAGETCDDGNTNSGDGCDAVCQIEPICGNGVIEAPETCDDGNTNSGDGCDAVCQIEPICGNGVIEAPETCDDGNTNSGDGCDAVCQVEGCLVTMTGDVNTSGTLTSADIIGLVNYVFKGGAAPAPCPAAGDVNCSGSITSADIITLVNHVFKGGPPPCNVCSIIPAQWTCP